MGCYNLHYRLPLFSPWFILNLTGSVSHSCYDSSSIFFRMGCHSHLLNVFHVIVYATRWFIFRMFLFLSTWDISFIFLCSISSSYIFSLYRILSWCENLDNLPFQIKTSIMSFNFTHSYVMCLSYRWKRQYWYLSTPYILG